MIWLLAILGALLFAAAVGHFVGARAARSTGLPDGNILLQDTSAGFAPCETLVSSNYGLVGRPDYVIETPAGLVPV